MRNLVDYFNSHLEEDKYYFTDIDVSDKIMKFEQGFREFSGQQNIEDNSKEMMEDLVFLTYLDKENNVAYLGATTLMNTDVLMRIPEAIVDINFDSSGINIFVQETKKNEDDNTPKKRFLGYKIYFSKKDGTNRELASFNLFDYLDKLGKYPMAIYENREDKCILVYNSDDTIYLTDYDFNLLLDVTPELEDSIREEIGEKYSYSLGLYSHDLIGIKVFDNSIDVEENFFADNLLCTYVYSVSKAEVLQRLPDGVNISRLFNISNMKDYANNSFIWITKSLFEWKEEYTQWVKNNDIEKVNELINMQSESTVNGLVPLYNIKDEDDFFYKKFVPMSTNANDIGGYIDGLQQFYTIDNNEEKDGLKPEFRYTYNFYTAKDNNIVINKIQSNTIPRNIYFCKDTSVSTFYYKVDGFDQVVSYWKDYGDIIKYSKILIKDKDLNRIRKVVSDIKEHILVLNGGNESAADDEVSLLNNLINNKEYYEDKDTSQLLSNHLVNLGTGDIGISIDRITYGQEGRLMVYKYKIGNQDYLKRIRMNQSLDELYEEEMEKDKDIMEYSKDQKEKIERDIKNGII